MQSTLIEINVLPKTMTAVTMVVGGMSVLLKYQKTAIQEAYQVKKKNLQLLENIRYSLYNQKLERMN